MQKHSLRGCFHMHSIRTKITLLTLGAIFVSMVISTFIGVVSIRNLGSSDAEEMLRLMCRTGEKNLDSYFESVERSVTTVSNLVSESFDGLSDEKLEAHVERARNLFGKIAYQTNGVLTYYYRIDPAVSSKVKGFWYVNLDGEEFIEHEVTDITLYDTNDTSSLVWFTVPKATGKGVWLPPYITDNLDVRVLSYNVPVYCEGVFVGVIGIEIDYETLAHEVENIRLFKTGYAFVMDMQGQIIYHPQIGSEALTKQDEIGTPEELLSADALIRYRFNGSEKVAVWLPLENGMRLFVTVPRSEINSGWQSMIQYIVLAFFILLLLVGIVTMRFAGRITKPLSDLTEAAKQADKGNYEFTLNYNKNDEVGILTHTFKVLSSHTRDNISTLKKKVYIDALTGVLNKGAYADHIQTLQDRLDVAEEKIEFAMGVFDCDNLKAINDTYGHEKGDLYLKYSSNIISKVFRNSPVFRIGGDEFAVILQNEDYLNRDELLRRFRRATEEMNRSAREEWEKVSVTYGLAVYKPKQDMAVIDVARRADQIMYDNKRLRKEQQEKN